MPLPKRPRDPIARAKLVMDMLTGRQGAGTGGAALGRKPNQQEPTGYAKAAKARCNAASS